MAPRAHASPRSVTGGRSARYEPRRAARGSAAGRAYAPAWSDASAAAMLAALHRSWKASLVQHMQGHCLYLMVSASRVETLAQSAEAGLSPSDRRVARALLRAHSTRIRQAWEGGRHKEAMGYVHSFLKPLRDRAAKKVKPTRLAVSLACAGPTTAAAWLSTFPERDRHRDISRNKRILDGLSKWKLSWLDSPGVVCYERGAARVARERPVSYRVTK